jgi:hypothetical protein
MLPYLDVSTLKETPSLFFGLLRHRTQHNLVDWATSDLYQMDKAWQLGLLPVIFSPLCMVMYGKEYGALVPFEPNAAHRGDIVGFPRSLHLLEAQATLMSFLDNVVNFHIGGRQPEKPIFTEMDSDVLGWVRTCGRRCGMVTLYIPAFFSPSEARHGCFRIRRPAPH